MTGYTLRNLLKRFTRDRQIHCFCLGAAKTGTTSFSSMFERHYRSAHEPDVRDLTETVEKVVLGKLQDFAIRDWLRRRDRRLNLEVEASHPLGYLAPWLPGTFPDAKFIITIRDPLPWLKSRLNFHYQKTPEPWQRYRDFIWGRHHSGYSPEEEALEELGLYSLDAYLGQYSEQYRLLFNHLPEEKRLVLRTECLGNSMEQLASFLQIASTTISHKHENRLSPNTDIITMLPADFVRKRIDEHCGWLAEHMGP